MKAPARSLVQQTKATTPREVEARGVRRHSQTADAVPWKALSTGHLKFWCAGLGLLGLLLPAASAQSLELLDLPLEGQWGQVSLLRGPGQSNAPQPRVASRPTRENMESATSLSDRLELVSRTLEQGGMAYSVAANLNHCYVGTSGSLATYDVSVPAAPVLVHELEGGTASLEHAGTTLGAVQGCDGDFVMYDISTPDAPAEISRVAPPAGFYYNDIALGADHVAVTGYGYLEPFGWCDLLQVVDVSTPAMPLVVSSMLAVLTDFGDVARNGDTLYLSTSNGLLLLDISYPQVIGILGMAPATYNSRGIDYDNGHVFLSGNGLEIVDVQNPQNPVIVGQASNVYTSDVEVVGDYAYEANDDDLALWVFDISDLTTPVLVGSVEGQGTVNSLDVDGNRAYVPDSVYGLLVIDIATPTSPQLVSTTSTGVCPFGVDVEGSVAAVSTNLGQVRTLDLTNPKDPVQIGMWQQTPQPGASNTFHQVGVDLAGDLLVTSDWARDGSPAKLLTYDTTDLASPIFTGEMTIGGASTPVVRQVGTLVYTGGNPMLILDVSNPASPVQVGQGPSFGAELADILIEGSLCFVASSDGEVATLDISSPLTPVELSRVQPGGFIAGIALDGNLLAVFSEDLFNGPVVEYSARIQFYDVTDPSLPVLTGEVAKPTSVKFTSPGGACMAAEDGVFFVAATDQLLAIDATTPQEPFLAATYPTAQCSVNKRWASYSGVDLAHGLIYLAGHDGLEVLRYKDVGLRLTPASNPLVVSRGEYLHYDVELTNFTEEVQVVEATLAPLFGGGQPMPMLHPFGILQPGETMTQPMQSRVPLNATLGEHTLKFSVRTEAAGSQDREHFTFEVVP